MGPCRYKRGRERVRVSGRVRESAWSGIVILKQIAGAAMLSNMLGIRRKCRLHFIITVFAAA
jgi:hypothetical protein